MISTLEDVTLSVRTAIESLVCGLLNNLGTGS